MVELNRSVILLGRIVTNGITNLILDMVRSLSIKEYIVNGVQNTLMLGATTWPDLICTIEET